MAGHHLRYLGAAVLLACSGCQADTAKPDSFSERLARLGEQQAGGGGASGGEPQARMIATGPPVYECTFKTHGTIVIDTNPRDARIVIDGQSMPAEIGRDTYRSIVGNEVVRFGPDLSYWEYKGERSENCRII